jgi:peptide/nickel transport system substrate-binding protein
VATVVSACGTSAESSSASTLRYAAASEPDCLDPGVSADDATELIGRPIFDSLISLGTDKQFHPWLAQRWTISPDGLVYTFALRKGIVFHDGSPLDANAVKASLDHAVDPRTKSKYARSLLEGYQETRVTGPLTLEIRLSAPKAALLEGLSSVYLGIQSAKALRDAPADRCVAPVGSGPFKFTAWKRHDSITLGRNPGYTWGPAGSAGPARLQTLDFRFVTEDAVRVGELTSGQVDAAGAIPATGMAALEADTRFKTLRAQLPGASYGLYLNPTRGPLADTRVRLALRDALDVDKLVSAIYRGQARPAWSPLSPTTTYYDPTLENSWHPDVAAANRLLDEAGWTARDAEGYRTRDGKRLSLRWPGRAGAIRDQREILNQGVQAQARSAGIQIDLVVQDPGAYGNDILNANLDLFATSYQRADADILRHFFGARRPADGGGNVTGLLDPVLVDQLDKASASADPKVRASAYATVQHRLVDNGFVIPVYVPETVVGVASTVQGLAFDGQTVPSFTTVRLGA